MSFNNQPKHKIGSIALSADIEGCFQIDDGDLSEHFYIIGRSGSGKTNLLLNLAIADIKAGRGICFIDPIGDAAEMLLTHIDARSCASDSATDTKCTKSARDKDIIYFNAADTGHPIGINPLYNVDKKDRSRAVSDILQMFSSIWHDSGWGPRMEAIFRAALHTLIENPHCSRPSLLTVFRLLLDQEFRHQTKQDIDNQQLLDWWDLRFDHGDLNERTRREWVEPVLNKIDALSLDPVIRNIIGQPRTILDFDQIIKRKQILIVNLAQNKIGLDNASFIGMLIISKIRQAAAKEGKRDQPFHLTIDEAHTFPTMELGKIITQGRHSGLYARISHQHLEQFDPKIASSLRNGSGSLAVFAIGTRDGEVIVDDLEAINRDRTLNLVRNLGTGEAVMRLTQNGAPQPPSPYPVKIEKIKRGNKDPQSAINFTRERYATDKLTAEFQIAMERGTITREEKLLWMAKFKLQKRERSKAQRPGAQGSGAQGSGTQTSAAQRSSTSPNDIPSNPSRS